MPIYKNWLLCTLIFLSFAPALFAQNQESTLIINVKNQLGEVIIDAEITLSKGNKTEKFLKSNKLGVAQFTKIPDGEYKLNIVAAGFSDYKNDSVFVKKGEINRLEITLDIATVESKVVISGEDGADTENFGTTKVINEKEIEKLPDDPKELERMLKKIAGESVTGEEMPITVDGVQGGKIPPKQAIQQIRINQNVFSAQYEGPNGGGIEIFSRSNIDKFSGYANFSFADSRIDAADPFLGRRVPSQLRNYYFYLSGPINKKTSFFLNTSHTETDSSAVINAIILNSALQPTEFKQTFATPNRNNNLSFNLSSDPTKKHKISMNYWSSISRGVGQTVGGFSLPSRANNSKNQYHSFRIGDTFLASENVISQTRFSTDYSINKSFGGSNEAAINVLDAFFGGGSQTDSSNKNLTFEMANDTTWQMGKYGLGFGWKIRGQKINQISRSNFGGTYTFSGRNAPVLDGNNNIVLDASGNVVTTQINSLESYRRTLLFRQLGYSNSQIRTLGGGANQFTISGGNPEISVNQYDFGLYLQNSYKISETLAASAGLRYENQTNINDKLNIAPRFGLIWSPKTNPKKNLFFALPRISVGVGMFYRRFELNNFLSVKQSNDADRSQYLITDPNILDIFPSVPSVTSLQQFAQPKSQRFIDSELEAPLQKVFNISASKKLPFGFSMNATLAYTKNSRQSLTRNINAPLAGTFNQLIPNSGVRPFGNTGNIYQTISTGKGENTRISVSLSFPEKYVWGNIRYSFLKSKNDTVGGSGAPFDAYNFSREYSPTVNDGVHSLSGYFYYQLPLKFSLNSDFSISSGTRFNITTGRDTNGDGFYNERPAFATNLNKPNLVTTKYGVLDPNPTANDVLIPRNLGRGPTVYNVNAGLSKSFGFGADVKNKKPPKQTLSFSVRVGNIFNIVNKGNPVGNMSSPNFLRSLSNSSPDGLVFINGAQANASGARNFNFSVGFGF